MGRAVTSILTLKYSYSILSMEQALFIASDFVVYNFPLIFAYNGLFKACCDVHTEQQAVSLNLSKLCYDALFTLC